MKTFIRGISAGILISIGCIVYSMCDSKLLGAFLFSFGLFCIVNYQLNLYTGKIGYLVENFNKEYIIELGLTLLGNLLGTIIVAFVMQGTRSCASMLEFIQPIVSIKNSDTFLSLFILSVFCGMLMFLGVDIFKKSDNMVSKVLAVVFAVVIFILAGFEHCVANMFYMFFAMDVDILRLLIMVVGNSVGGMLICLLINRGKIEKKV